MNIAELLKKYAKKGDILYSRFLGDVEYVRVDPGFENSPGFELIIVQEPNEGTIYYLYNDGRYRKTGEVDLFPSKDQRDWNKWVEEKESEPQSSKSTPPPFVTMLLPFDKVLVRNNLCANWVCELFDHVNSLYHEKPWVTLAGTRWKYCIPFNNETKHLVGTSNEPNEDFFYC